MLESHDWYQFRAGPKLVQLHNKLPPQDQFVL